MSLRTLSCLGLSLSLVLAVAVARAEENRTGPAAATAPQMDPNVDALRGMLLIQWHDEKRFVYVPDNDKPLVFKMNDGREIRPGRMYTDGGSIPRVFWGFKGFSPWGYAPAYVLHDWLYHQHRCRQDVPPQRYSFAESNQVLDDVIAILFKRGTVEPNAQARSLIKWAVDNFAQSAWREPCDPQPAPELLTDAFSAPARQVTVARFSFD
jgi:hypothetical protein